MHTTGYRWVPEQDGGSLWNLMDPGWILMDPDGTQHIFFKFLHQTFAAIKLETWTKCKMVPMAKDGYEWGLMDPMDPCL